MPRLQLPAAALAPARCAGPARATRLCNAGAAATRAATGLEPGITEAQRADEIRIRRGRTKYCHGRGKRCSRGYHPRENEWRGGSGGVRHGQALRIHGLILSARALLALMRQPWNGFCTRHCLDGMGRWSFWNMGICGFIFLAFAELVICASSNVFGFWYSLGASQKYNHSFSFPCFLKSIFEPPSGSLIGTSGVEILSPRLLLLLPFSLPFLLQSFFFFSLLPFYPQVTTWAKVSPCA